MPKAIRTTNPQPPVLTSLIDVLSSIRNARGIAQWQLAEWLNVTPNTLSRWEAHTTDPSARQLFRWLTALDAHLWLTATTPNGFVCEIPTDADVVHEHLDALAGPIEWVPSRRPHGSKALVDMILARRAQETDYPDPRARAHPRGGVALDDRVHYRE